jgi:large subunit ribosomal protein L21
VHVERLVAEVGTKIQFEDVLAVRRGKDLEMGRPTVDGANVEATVLSHGLGSKVIVFKKKRRKQYRRTRGHRQEFTAVRIERITAGAAKSAPAKQES